MAARSQVSARTSDWGRGFRVTLSASGDRRRGADAPSVYLGRLPKQGAASDAANATHLESHLINPLVQRSDDFDGFVGRRQEALLGLIEAATGKAIYRGAATDEPVEDMIEDEAEGLEAAE